MFGQQLSDQMRTFIDELKLSRQRKQAAAARGRAIDCMELEDRILLSASPIAPEAMVNKPSAEAQQTVSQSPKAVAADANGNHVVAFSSQNPNGSWVVNAQRFNAAGVAQGDKIQVSSESSHEQKQATVAMNANGSFVITWTENNADTTASDVYAKRFDADGNAIGDAFRVNSTTGEDQVNPSVAMNSSDGFIVTWSSHNQDGDGWGVFGKQFDSNGNQVGEEFQISSTTVGDQMSSRVATDSSGNFTVIWQSQDTDGQGIFGQRFDSSGSQLGDEFRVNATTAGNQLNANIAMNSAGDFVVTWTSEGQDGDGQGIYAQRFSADGSTIGNEFLVNATTVGDQNFSAVAMDDSGVFLISWSSFNQDSPGTWGVYTQAYSADGSELGPETRVNNTIDGSQENPSVAFLGSNSYAVVWSGSGVGDSSGVFEAVCDIRLLGERVYLDPINTVPTDQNANLNTPIVFSAENGNAILVTDLNSDPNTSSVPVENCDFESPVLNEREYVWGDSYGGWNFEAMWYADGSYNDSGIVANYNDSWFGNWNPAPDGQQVAFIESAGTFWRDVDFAEDGNYVLKLQAAYSTWYWGISPTNPTLIQVDGESVGVIYPNSTDYKGYQSSYFAVTAGTHRISFTGLCPVGDDTITFIDQVKIEKTESYVQVNLSVDSGTLNLGSTGNLVFSSGNGANNNSMMFIGTAAEVNAALEGLQYVPSADFTGTANLQITTTNLASILVGDPKSDTDTVAIQIAVPTETTGLLGTYYNRTNLALGKTATQSSDPWGYPASNAVDGKYDVLGDRSFSHTYCNPNEWWQVDLSPGTNTELNEIKIYNVLECGDRLQNFTISVIAADGTTVWSQVYNEPTYSGEVLTFKTGNISGEFVRIQKNDANYLHLPEVEVYNSVPIERIDSTIDFNWGNEKAPASNIDGTNWMATWQGQVLADYSEIYTFSVSADDGYRLWVNNQLLFDSWQSGGTSTGTIDLEAGQWYSIRLDYNQGAGNAAVGLTWSCNSQSEQAIPSDHLSCADLLENTNPAPVNTVPSELQSVNLSDTLVFSTENGNAIQVSGVEESNPSDTIVAVSDSDFESPQIGNYVEGGSYDGWLFTYRAWDNSTLGASGLAANGSEWVNPDAPSGNQVAVLFGHGTISQDVTFTEAGNYSISFEAAYLVYPGFAGPNPISVRIDGVEVDVITPTTADHFEAYQTKGFAVTAGVHCVSFTGVTPNGEYRTSYIDQVSITKNANVLQVTLSADQGLLTLTNTDGVAIIGSDGVQEATLTVVGTAEDLNAALEGLQYYSLDFAGTANLQITTSDMASILAGGAKTDTSNVAIQVTVRTIAPETLVNQNTLGVQQTAAASSQSVAADSNGNYVVVWSGQNQDNGTWDVYAQRFNPDGVALGDQFQVNTRSEYDQQDAKVAMREDGTFAVTWVESDGNAQGTADIYVRSYDANGNALQGQDILVNDGNTAGDQLHSSVSINWNGIYVVWTSQNQDGNWDLYGKWLDNVGNTVRSENQINWTSSAAPMQSQVGMDPWGYVMVVWQTETNAQQDVFGRYGSFANWDGWDTGEFALSMDTNGNQYNPSLGWKINDGAFVASWTSESQDGSGNNIIAQRFDYCAGRIGSEFQVNSVSVDDQDYSSIAVDKNTGNFLITWSSDVDGTWDVHSQMYTSDGTPYGPKTRANATMDGSQSSSSVVFLSSTRYAVVWSGNGTGDESGVYSAVCDTANIVPYAAPVNTVPGAQSIGLNTSVVFSLANGNAIQVTDSDESSNVLQVTLAVDNGMLTLSGIAGLTFSQGCNGCNLMTFTGTQADINAALDGLQYTPVIDFTGTANLQITSVDSSPFLAGGPKTDADTIAITVAVPSEYQGLLGTYYNNSNGLNLALGKTATQSSEGWGGVASNVTNGSYSDWNHTLADTNEWLQVDLGSNTELNQIVIYNRYDGCGDRLQNFTLSVIDSDGNTVWSQVYNETTYTGEKLTFNTGTTISGQYIKIQKNYVSFLHITELEVYNVVPSVTRIDPTIDFDWGNQNSPAPGIAGSNWTVSWQGEVTADYTGTYTFYGTADDGVRVWVNDQLLCDGWYYQGATTYQGTIDLEAGQQYSIRMDYFQGGWGESAKLEWSCNDSQGNELLGRQVISSNNLSCANLIQSGNAVPVNSMPADQSLGINSSLVFSSVNGNAITIGDADSEAASTSVSIANSSFETGDGWNFTSCYWTADSTAYGTPSASDTIGNLELGPTMASDGSRFGRIVGYGTLSQAIEFSEAGTYTLSLQAAHRDYFTGNNPSNPISVRIDGIEIGVITPDSVDFKGYSLTFSTSAGVHTLEFVGLDTGGGDRSTFIDQVAINKSDSLVQATVSVTAGTFTLNGTNGLVLSSGTGKNDTQVTMIGTVADINAALDGLKYVPNVNFLGEVALTVTTNDMASPLLGGAKTDTDTVTIHIAVPTEHTGLLATYYNNTSLAGDGIQRIDSTVDFNLGGWGNQVSPAPGISGTDWSARWEGKIQATTTGTYTFYVTADDGVRLWVNDAYFDGWTYQAGVTYTLTTNLEAGQWYTFRMEYFQGWGESIAKLEWSAPGQARELIPASQLSWENTAPEITVPTEQTTDENTDIVFSTDNGNAIQVSDLDTINGTLEVTLEVDSGTLALAKTDGLTFDNLALGKTATLTNGIPDYPASRAVDGIYDTWGNRNFFHTYYATDPILEIDLSPGTNTQLNQIKIYTNLECGERLQDFTVSVIAADGSVVWSETNHDTTYNDEVIVFNTGNISGEYVRIQQLGTDYFHLAEVEVYNVAPSGSDNGVSSMTFTGTEADINAALDGLTYTPAISESGEYIGAANLQITVNDMASELIGGSQTTTSTVPIAITAPWSYNGLLGTYYNNENFTGTTVQRVDSAIDFNWGNETSPVEGIESDTWSARWIGTIQADYTETYTFYTSADDGVRLWVNGKLLVDHLNNAGTDSYSATIDMVAGQTYSFRMDYQQTSGDANAKLEWSSASQAREVVSASNFQTADQTPINVVPGEQDGIGNQPIVFSESSSNTIAVTELHYDGNPLIVTLTASHGTLTLGSESGVTITDGANGSSVLTFTGSLADINAALDGLTYTRQSDYAGSAAIQMTSINPSAVGGPRSTTDTIQIGSVQTSNPGLVATYYSDTWLGTAVTSKIDSQIDFNWGANGSPATGVAATNWSVCWDGLIEAQETGTYTFHATSDDGCRLWVNGELLVDNWGPQALSTNSGTIDLAAGQKYSIHMEYCQFSATSLAKLEWETPIQAREVVSAGALSHQNQAPINYLPVSASVNEDSTVVFSTANGNAISISDVDAQSNLLEVALSVTNGTISLGNVNGLNFTAGDGVGDAAIIFTGSLADINAALNGLSFSPTDHYSGGASLRIVTTDLGTEKSTESSMPITVVAVNEAPTIIAPGSASVQEYQTITFSSENGNAIVVGDLDIATDASYVPIVNGDFESPDVGTGFYTDQYHGATPGWTLENLYWTNGNTVPNSSGLAGNGAGMGNPNSTDGTQVVYLQGGGAITQDIFFAEAGSYNVSFQSAYRQYGGPHSFSVLVDGVNIGTFTPNSLEFQGYSATFSVSAGTHRITFRGLNEGGDRTAFIDHVSIAKTSSLVQMTLSVEHGTLSLSNFNGVTFSTGDGKNDASMTFTGSLADVNAVLDGLTFTPVSNYTGIANLHITSNDLGNTGIGGPKSSSSTVAINILAVNDAPYNNVPLTTQGTYGNQAIVFSVSNNNAISIGDPDADVNPSDPVVSNSSFETQAGWNFTSTYWTADSTAYGTPSAGDTIASGELGPTTTTDGSRIGRIVGYGTLSQDIEFVEAGTYTLSFLGAHRDYYTGDNATNPIMILIDGIEITTITPDSVQFKEYSVTFAVSAGSHTITFQGLDPGGGDRTTFIDRVAIEKNAEFPVQVTLAAANGTLTLKGTEGLTFSTGDGAGDGTMTFTGTIDDINTALNGLSYMPTSGFIGTDNLQITTNDLGNHGIGGEKIASSTVTINVAGGPVVNSTTEGVQQLSWESPQAVASDSSGNYVVVWTSQTQDGGGWGIYARRFNASNIAQGDEFLVNTVASGDQLFASVAMNAGGNFVVSWTDTGDGTGSANVFARCFNADGSAHGDQFQVNNNTGTDQKYSSVAIGSNGNFVVTWSSQGQDGDGWSVFGQCFDSSGNRMGSEFQVNATAAGDQMYARSAMDSSGNFTVVWQSQGQDGDGWGIYGRRFDSSGNPVSDEFQINETTSGNQYNANIGMNASGNFVVTWTNEGENRQGVFAKQYNADGSCTDEFQVAGSTQAVYTVAGCGLDIGGHSDQFNFASTSLTGDGEIIAQITSITDGDNLAKAGVMLRTGLDANAMHAMMFVSSDGNACFQWRSGTGEWFGWEAKAVDLNGEGWVKLVRTGNAFSGFYSSDGVTWTQVGDTQTIVMGETVQAGLAVNSRSTEAIASAIFANVTINGSSDITLIDSDIGSPSIAGSLALGSEFVADSTSTIRRDYSSVAVDRQGNFFINWSSLGQDTPDLWSVYGQRYSSDGACVGSEVRINATTDGSQAYSSITALSPDNYMVVWSGSAPGETAGVFYSQQSPVGLLVSYYNNTSLSGTPVAQNVSTEIGISPAVGVNSEFWSARWTGLIKANTTETYTFYTTADDGVRLYVNGALLIDNWTNQYATERSATINMLAGEWYDISLEYYQYNGPATVKLEWSSDSVSREVIPLTQFAHNNQTPINSLPALASTIENNSMTFSNANGNPISVNDLDSDSDAPMTVSLSVNHGTLSLGGFEGLTMLAGDGVEDEAISFRGTAAAINAALDGLVFTPTTDFRGGAALQISSTDEGGKGGPQTTTTNLPINVIGVNHAPVNWIPGAQSVIEHQTLIFSRATGNPMSISDQDSGDTPVQVTLTSEHGKVSLSGTDGLIFLEGDGIDDATVTMMGSISSINAALDGLQFKPTDNFGGITQLKIKTDDLGASFINGSFIVQDAVDIAVTAINDLPVNVLPGTQTAFTQYEKIFSTATGNAIHITDPDAVDSPVQVTLSADGGKLTLNGTEGLTFFTGDGTDDALISIQGTLADINAALEGMQFQARSNYQGMASLKVTTNDLNDGSQGIGGPKTMTNTMAIITRSVNPPEVIATNQNVEEDHSIVFSQATGNAISISDSDVGNLPVQVTLETDFGTLSLSGVNGLTFSNGTGSTGSTMTFTGTIADINAALEGLEYTPNEFESDLTTGIRITVNDLCLGHTGPAYTPQITTRTVAIGLVSVNEAPSITMPESAGIDLSNLRFSTDGGNPIHIGDPDAGNNPVVVEIQVSDGTFSLATTEGLLIAGGTPSQSNYVVVQGTLDSINKALDGLTIKASSSYAAMQIKVNDLGNTYYQGIGGENDDIKQVFYVRRAFDPNFQPGDSSALFQVKVGVLNQQVATAAASTLADLSQERINRPQIDSEGIDSSALTSGLVQNMNVVRADSGAGERGSERLVNRGDSDRMIEMPDIKETKLAEEVLISADAQIVNEPIQQGATFGGDDGILVGLGMVSAGYLAWAFNGGSLLAGAISATPMWMPLDPLAILDITSKGKAGILPLDDAAGLAGDDNLQSMLS